MAIEFTPTFEFQYGSDKIITLKRILDLKKSFQASKNFKFIPIENSAYFYFAAEIDRDPLILPKLYSGLTILTGHGDERYDDYKGSYSFTFELIIDQNNNINIYAYHLYHYRSYIEFSLYHRVPKSDIRSETTCCQPDDNLFSDKEITGFSIGFCNQVIKHIDDANYKPEPFVKYSDSNLILFGYIEDNFFCDYYEDQEEYTKQREILKNRVAND